MSLSQRPIQELKPRIVVFGVGGAGGNAINNMIESGVEGVEFVVANTDSQDLMRSKAAIRLQLGEGVTEGLGAGARPEIGAAAAEESEAEIQEVLEGAHMCFIAAGMGGGTGTGAAPVVARLAKELDVLTVAIVTKPFHFEGAPRMAAAERGLAELRELVDTLIVIPNQNLFRIVTDRTSVREAFALADEVLHQGVRGVTDLMVTPGLINLDFADIRTVMAEEGAAMLGVGEAEGEGRAVAAVRAAVTNPLLDDVSLKGARGLVVNIAGGESLSLFEVEEAASAVRQQVDENAQIFIGSSLDPAMGDLVRVTVVATGLGRGGGHASAPAPERLARAERGKGENRQAGGGAASPGASEGAGAPKQDARDAGKLPDKRADTKAEKKAEGGAGAGAGARKTLESLGDEDDRFDMARRLLLDTDEAPLDLGEPMPGGSGGKRGAGGKERAARKKGRGMFGLFGGGKPAPQLEPLEPGLFDMVDEAASEDLDIPAFLRRRA